MLPEGENYKLPKARKGERRISPAFCKYIWFQPGREISKRSVLNPLGDRNPRNDYLQSTILYLTYKSITV
jgi:phage terminase Nu1 subunit (DNA packaging protein)